MKAHPSLVVRSPFLLFVGFFVGLAACTEAAPIDLTPDDNGTGTAGTPAEQPAFTPYVPPSQTGAAGQAGSGSGSAGSSGPGTGGAAAGQGGAGGRPLAGQVIANFFPIGIDDSGTRVAGMRDGRAMGWTTTTGARALPFASATDVASAANSISPDGKFIVGCSGSAMRPQAVRWAGLDAVESLKVLLADTDSSVAVAVSADDSTIVGTSRKVGAPFGLTERAFQWRNQMVSPILPLPGDSGTEAVIMSADGSTVAGYSYDAVSMRQRTFWWNIRTGPVAAEVTAPGGVSLLVPRFLSADGSVLILDAVTGRKTFPGVSDVVTVLSFRAVKGGGVFVGPPVGVGSSRVSGLTADGVFAVATSFDLVGTMELNPVPFFETGTVSASLPLGGFFDHAGSVVVNGAGTLVAGIASRGAQPPSLIVWPIKVHTGVPQLDPFPLAPSPLPSPTSELVAVTNNGTLLGRGTGQDGQPLGWLVSLPVQAGP